MKYWLIYNRHDGFWYLDCIPLDSLAEAQNMGDTLINQGFIDLYSILKGTENGKDPNPYLWIVRLVETGGDAYVDMIRCADTGEIATKRAMINNRSELIVKSLYKEFSGELIG